MLSGWLTRRCCALVLLAGTWGTPAAAAAAPDAPREYEVKSALVYNFTQFVEWPPVAFNRPEDPLVIGIIGRNPFGDTLEKIVERERSAGHRIVVQQCRNMVEATRCHVLFVGANERDDLQQILRGLGGRPILTVGEFDGFISGGGMVRLHRNVENKIRIRINLEAVRKAGLNMSAKLLRVVEVVPPDEE